MTDISCIIIGKLIQAHLEKDEEKFQSYANLIIKKYEEADDKTAVKIIKSKLDGSYKNNPNIISTFEDFEDK